MCDLLGVIKISDFANVFLVPKAERILVRQIMQDSHLL